MYKDQLINNNDTRMMQCTKRMGVESVSVHPKGFIIDTLVQVVGEVPTTCKLETPEIRLANRGCRVINNLAGPQLTLTGDRPWRTQYRRETCQKG